MPTGREHDPPRPAAANTCWCDNPAIFNEWRSSAGSTSAKVAQIQTNIHLAHLSDRIGYQIFVTHIDESARRHELTVLLESLVHQHERVQHVTFDPSQVFVR